MANYGISNSSFMGGGLAPAGTTANFLPLITIANSYNIQTLALVGLGSSYYKRGKLYDLLIGTIGTPGDQAIEWDVITATLGCTTAAFTAGGISSLSSNFQLDPFDNTGAACTIAINTTGGNTAGVVMQKWYVGVNQRASYRWVAAPGSEIMWAAVSSGTTTSPNGMVVRVRSTGGYTGNTSATVMYQEQ